VSEPPLFERPLDEMLPPPQPPRRPQVFSDPTTGPGSVVRERPDAELLAIAWGQKWLIRIFLLHVLLGVGAISVGTLLERTGRPPDRLVFALFLCFGVAGAILSIAAIVFVVLIASKLHGAGTAALLGVCQFLPCVGLIILLVVNAEATNELGRNGIRVGLLGARRSDLRALAPWLRKLR